MTGSLRLCTILLRRYRWRLVAWIVPLAALVAVTIPSYAATYPALAERTLLVDQLRSTVATRVLYGVLPLPGTLGQLMQWETGAYVVLLTAAMAILLTTALTRGDEDSGITEIVATSGIGRWAQPTAVALLLTGTFATLGGLIALIGSLESIGTTEVGVSGSCCFGAVIMFVGLFVSAATMLFAEVCWDVASTHVAAWTFFVVSFAMRVAADFTSWTWLRWPSWAGIKDLVAPYTQNRVLPLAATAATVVVLGVGAALVHVRREYGTGLVSIPMTSTRRLRVSSVYGLAARLGFRTLVLWMLPTIGVAALFGGMSKALVSLIRDDSSMSHMIAQITRHGGPVQQYFQFSYLFIAALALGYGVSTVLRASTAERAGLLDAQLCAGVRRWQPLMAQTLLAAAGAAVLLVLGGGVEAGVAARLLGGNNAAAWAWWTVVGQLPGVFAAIGLAALAVALLPRLPQVAWMIVGWSGFCVLLGGLVRLPQWARSAAVLGHAPAELTGGFSGAVPWLAWSVLAAITGVTLFTAAAIMRRRDVILS